MKKIFSLIILVLFISAALSYAQSIAFAENQFASKAVYLADYDTGTVICSKNENAKLPIASMCKIMTLNLIFEEIDAGRLTLEECIPISKNSSGMGGSQAFLEEGGSYTANELIKTIIMASANDSCVAFAEKIAGSEEAFTEKMNEKAKEYGMNNTVFANCTGLPRPTQYSCAKDVAKMFTRLLSHEQYYKYSTLWMDEISHPKGRTTGLTNTNKLIRYYDGCDGGKTGFTSEAGHCIAATAKRGNMRLVSVVICAPDSKTRFKETSDMFNYGFSTFTNKTVVDSARPLEIQAEVKGGLKKTVEIIPENDYHCFSKKNESQDIRLDFNPISSINAPVKKGDIVGEIIVYKDNIEQARIRCMANEDVGSKPYFSYVTDIMRDWLV